MQAVAKRLDVSLPEGADEHSINFTLAQLIMVMERLDTQIGAAVPGVIDGKDCLQIVSLPASHSFPVVWSLWTGTRGSGLIPSYGGACTCHCSEQILGAACLQPQVLGGLQAMSALHGL